jgi:hypothetical protein
MPSDENIVIPEKEHQSISEIKEQLGFGIGE